MPLEIVPLKHLEVMKPNISITPADARQLKRAMVYAWVRGSEYLYVGCTTRGIDRIGYHNIIDVVEPFNTEIDRVLCWYFPHVYEAEGFECFMISKTKPKYNERYLEYVKSGDVTVVGYAD